MVTAKQSDFFQIKNVIKLNTRFVDNSYIVSIVIFAVYHVKSIVYCSTVINRDKISSIKQKDVLN